MSEYIFYTPEGFTQAPDGEEIENCQLLGIAHGKDAKDALQKLIEDNPWILDRGYSLYKVICKELAAL